MKKLLRKLASPLLNSLENSEGDYQYSPSHRTVLKVMGLLFLGVAGVTLYFVMKIEEWAGLLPFILFGGIGLLALLVAYVGSDKAVAKLWRNRNETISK